MENLLKLEKENIAEFQKETYIGTQKAPNVLVRFANDVVKVGASNHVKVKLDSQKTQEGAKYIASQSFDVLFKLTGHVHLHPIKVLKKYKKTVRISYHHNIGHVIFSHGECKTDNEHYGYLDTKVLDIYSQAYSSFDDRKSNKEDIGSVPSLEDWHDELPKWTLRVRQPYYFTRNEIVALPILKSKNNNITFIYTLKTNLKELLRMQVLNTNTNEWIEHPPNLKYLDTGGKDYIEIPEMWGRYGEISEEERNWRKTGDEDTGGEPRKQVMIIEDWEIGGSKNPIPLDSKEEISLAATAPTRHVFWMASHVNAGPCNYTTNIKNVYEGWNPCKTAMIKYGTSKRTEELSHDHFDRAEFKDFGWLVPEEKGYNVWTMTFKPRAVMVAEPSTKMKEIGATLTITLGDTNPYNTEEEEEVYNEEGDAIPKESLNIKNETKDKYDIHVISVVARKMEIFWDDKTNSLKYNYYNI